MSRLRHHLVVPLLLLLLLMPIVGQQQLEPFQGDPNPRHPRPFTDVSTYVDNPARAKPERPDVAQAPFDGRHLEGLPEPVPLALRHD